MKAQSTIVGKSRQGENMGFSVDQIVKLKVLLISCCKVEKY